jgi:hypothetical protein
MFLTAQWLHMNCVEFVSISSKFSVLKIFKVLFSKLLDFFMAPASAFRVSQSTNTFKRSPLIQTCCGAFKVASHQFKVVISTPGEKQFFTNFPAVKKNATKEKFPINGTRWPYLQFTL